MGVILLDKSTPQGLLSRTQRLLEKEREQIGKSLEQPNGIWVHRLGNGIYRYETFLGSVGKLYPLSPILKSNFPLKLRDYL